MKKIYTYLIVLVLAIAYGGNTSAQSTLTNAQVYDFEVGDIILSRYQSYGIFGPGGPPAYITRTILAKSFSSNNDSIVYSVKTDSYTPAACQACTASYSSAVVPLIISDLGALAEHNNHTTCLGVADTSYLAYCNKQVWERHAVIDTGCFEPVTESSFLVAGLGGPYFNKIEPMGPLLTQYDLLAYRKYQDSCGVLLAVAENKLAGMELELFPNPSSDKIYVSGKAEIVSYDVLDFTGKLVLSGKLTDKQIDVSKLDKGSYIANFYTREFKVSSKKIEKL
ncbi:MAG: T9SS type A sorting domain-containing protein [Bacteroidota bacterium]